MPSALTNEDRFRMAFRCLHFAARSRNLSPNCHDAEVIAQTIASDRWETEASGKWLRFINGIITGEGDFHFAQERALAMAMALFERELARRRHYYANRNLGNIAREIGVDATKLRTFIKEVRDDKF